ncbi:hypothetical protein PsYK624_118280 [Phanerochaete sordida]|uniref:Uncharacterized protein n=1 Tax=Phanerochaete sordida TaxID=48140 RepID=A0A9P3GID6_9APHY|nr:hypothetical protein PsYK624_118280 [Phanerochaete sordida]
MLYGVVRKYMHPARELPLTTPSRRRLNTVTAEDARVKTGEGAETRRNGRVAVCLPLTFWVRAWSFMYTREVLAERSSRHDVGQQLVASCTLCYARSRGDT